MITMFVLLTILAAAGVLYVGIGIAFTLATIILKLMWMALHFVFSLGLGALIVAVAAVFLILKLTGLFVVAAFVFLVLALIWATGTLLGAYRRTTPTTPQCEPRDYHSPSGSGRRATSLQSRLENFDRRLRNIETIASRQ